MKNGIEIYQVLSRDLCDAIVKIAEENDIWNDTTIGEGALDKNIRDASVFNFEESDPLNGWFTLQLWEKIKEYNKKYKFLQLSKNEPPQILKYDIGQHYKAHTDQGTLFNRSLSTVVSLSDSDEYEGGNLEFPEQGLSYKLNKGEGVFFPSNFMYPHKVTPVMNGERYSLVTWIA